MQVTVTDISSRCNMFSVAGPDAAALLCQLEAQGVSELQPHSHLLLNFRGSPVIVTAGSGLATPGFTLIVDQAAAADLWSALIAKVLPLFCGLCRVRRTCDGGPLQQWILNQVGNFLRVHAHMHDLHGRLMITERMHRSYSHYEFDAQGAVPMGEEGWERQRILQGRPAAGRELTLEVNPLEAALYDAVSLGKGCYIGQETLAKVHQLGGPKQQLWGLHSLQPMSQGDPVLSGTS